MSLKILVICSRNKRRSLTAERLYLQHPDLEVRSAGTSPNSRHMVSIKDIEWADTIICMEYKHQDQLQRIFNRNSLPTIVVVNIPDEFKYMDSELVELLFAEIDEVVGTYSG